MIKRFKEFNESISGTEFVGSFGPNYGDTKIKNKTMVKYFLKKIIEVNKNIGNKI